MTITEFLLARIAEDEAEGHAIDALEQARAGRAPEAFVVFQTWGAARVLAECEAKRQIVVDRLRIDRSANGDEWSMGYSDANHDALSALAAIYADHPDYDPAWAL